MGGTSSALLSLPPQPRERPKALDKHLLTPHIQPGTQSHQSPSLLGPQLQPPTAVLGSGLLLGKTGTPVSSLPSQLHAAPDLTHRPGTELPCLEPSLASGPQGWANLIFHTNLALPLALNRPGTLNTPQNLKPRAFAGGWIRAAPTPLHLGTLSQAYPFP